MYAAGPSGAAALVAEEKEAYLLGKKRVDKVVDSGVAPVNGQLVPEVGVSTSRRAASMLTER